MIETLRREYHADASPVLLALRELLSKYPPAADYSAEKLRELLWELRYLPQHPADHSEVEAALEALRVDGEVVT